MSNLVTISYGDQPEFMDAVLRIIMEAGGVLEIETVQIGEEMKKLGFFKGFDEDVLKKIRCSKILLKALNAEVDTRHLCEVFDIDETASNEKTALVYKNNDYAIFEPSTPEITSILDAAISTLKHLRQFEVATRIENATSAVDLNQEFTADEFADAVIAKLFS